jgi:hypothetical protein
MIVGDVSKGYFASTTGAVSEQTANDCQIHQLAGDQRLNARTKGLQVQD